MKFKLTSDWGGIDFFRAVLKSCINLAAAYAPTGHSAILDPSFDSAREFVLHGTGPMGEFTRWVTFSDPLTLPRRGSADHAVLLTTRSECVEGVIQFFGQIPFCVRLSSNYSGPPIRCAYVVDPYRESNPAEERLDGDDVASYEQHVPSFAGQSETNNAEVQAALKVFLGRFMDHYVERENQKILQKAVDEAIELHPELSPMRNQLLEAGRKQIEKRFDRFEQTGDASGIVVVKT